MGYLSKKYIGYAFIIIGLAVVLGAFGAHIIQPKLSEKYFATYETANFYHFIHGLGIVAAVLALDRIGSEKITTIFILFSTGILLFSGSLYILSFNELLNMPVLKMLGAITPIGGILFILAWGLSGIELLRQ